MAEQARDAVGTVAAVFRYPVKSLVGERLERAEVDGRGVRGDRLWAVRDPDGRLGSGKSTRRFRAMDGLLALRARYDGEDPVVAFPDGRELRGGDPGLDDALSGHVGRPVALAREAEVAHHDEGPLHLVTTASLATMAAAGHEVDPRRLRPNLVLDTGAATGLPEDGWVGARLAVGEDLVLEVRAPMPRCVMITLPQHDLPAAPALLRAVGAVNDLDLGVVADVLRPGAMTVGDVVRRLG